MPLASIRSIGIVGVSLALAAGCAAKAAPSLPGQETAPTVTVAELRLLGVTSIDESRLRAALQTRTGSWLPFTSDPLFDRQAFDTDLKRIVAFYRDQGYPDARVESSDVDIDEARGEAIVTVRIREGDPLLVSAIALDGFDVFSPAELADLRSRLPIAIGQPIVFQSLAAGGEMAANALRDRGYPYAEVRVRETLAGTGRVQIDYTATPGPQAYFGEIEIVGNASVDDEIIRRQLAYRPGELFRRSRLQDSQRQLFALSLFQFATIEVLDPEARSSAVRTRVTVAEGKHQQVEFSFGYGTEEKLRGDLRWRHVNFLGAARTLAARTAWSSLNRGAQLDFGQPYFLHPRLRLALDGHYWHASEPAYTLSTAGGRAAVLADLDRWTTISLALKGDDQTSRVVQAALDDPSLRDDLIALGLDPETGEQGGLLTSLALGLQRNTTQNPLDPTDGYQLSAHIEQAGRWLPGTFDFVEWQLGGRYYRPLGARAVVATRLQLATIDPSGSSASLPFSRRYFLGGSTSLRGWGRYEVSPLTETGLPLGGNSMLESSVELRTRLKGDLGLALFADAGNVWRSEWQWDLADLRADAGAGLRYYTPVGPVRVDLAWQLTPIAGLFVDGAEKTRRWRIHFSIGQAF